MIAPASDPAEVLDVHPRRQFRPVPCHLGKEQVSSNGNQVCELAFGMRHVPGVSPDALEEGPRVGHGITYLEVIRRILAGNFRAS